MKIAKKFTGLLLASLMAVSLVACGVDITSVGLPSDMTLSKGESRQLEVEFGANDNATSEAIAKAAEGIVLNWTSSDEKVVTVDQNGLITAVGAGSAEVTVSIEDGNISSTCVVNVVVPAEGIVVPDEVELVINGTDSMELAAKATPEDATGTYFTYESSNASIVTVDEDGNITAVANGEADITTVLHQVLTATGETATSEDAATDTKFTAVTHVTVLTDVEAIVFENTEGILNVGNTYTISASVEPETASDNLSTLTWSSSDETIATVDQSGKVTANSAGNASITATAPNGISATYDLTVQVVKCSYCGKTGHTSSSCPQKAADERAAAQAAAQRQAAAAAAAQQQAAAQASGGGSTTSGGSSSGGSSGGTSAPAPAPAPAPDPGPSDSGGSSGGISHPEADIPGEIVTGGGNGVGVDAP